MNIFRVVWRATGDRLTQAWDAIVPQRQLCDEVVANTPSLQMFVSSVSGVVGKSGEAWRCIYPAVSYWAVFDAASSYRLQEDIERRIRAVCTPADVKPIKSMLQRQTDESVTADCQPLFVVLKDHNSRFVHQKIRRSLLATGAVNVSMQPPNAKLAVMHHSKYLLQLPASVEALTVAGLCIDLEVLKNK